MKATIRNTLLFTAFSFIIFACESSTKTTAESPLPPIVDKSEKSTESTECKDPRPQFCTKEYKPVCATKDTGVRCVTTPCPSTEKVTYSNGCTACTDLKVYSYVAGACK